MDAIVRVADRAGAWIVADEIYRGAELAGEKTTPTFWGRYERVVVTSGLSKAFAMPGLRVGWAVAPTDTIGRIWERHDYTTLTPGMVSDRLAAQAMAPQVRDQILARTRSIVRANYPRLESWLDSHADTFEWVRPTAGAIAFAKVSLPGSTNDLVDRIRTEQSVLLVSGEMFGIDNGIRFGFGYDIDRTLKGLAKIDALLK
jgi:aspartate/methionine/tyrosine aminotransferase